MLARSATTKSIANLTLQLLFCSKYGQLYISFPLITMTPSETHRISLPKNKNPFAPPRDTDDHLTKRSEPSPTIHIVAHDHNIKQKLLTITEDKTFLCLQRNLQTIGKRRWLHPLSLLLTMLLALATSDFNKLTWVSSELLKATFVVSSCITASWLIWEIMQDGRLKEIPQAIDDIFREMRAE
jgi:hypothetical protein